LNLEYFVEEPWLGGHHYVPQGFVTTNGKPREPYHLEVAPLLTRDGVQLHLKYESSAASLAQKLVEGFEQAVQSILKDNERYLEDERFWHQELDNAPLSNLEMFSAPEGSSAGWSSIPCDIPSDAIESICARLKSDSTVVLLSVLSVLLSRLNGREDFLVLTSIDQTTLPLRLNPSWNLGFGELVEQVSHKLTLARVHSAGASVDNAMFDVGFAFEATRFSVETFQQNLTLVLETTNDLNVAVAYERTRLGPDAAERIRSYLQAIISDVAADPAHVLGDIILDKTQHLPDPSADLAHDVFSFS
jgi:hypothetical protein